MLSRWAAYGVKPAIAGITTSTVVASAGTADWKGRPMLRLLADGTHMVVYRDGSNHSVNDGALHIRFRGTTGNYSNEDKTLAGASVSGWPLNPPLSANQDAGEPQLYVAPNGQMLLHSWRVQYTVSLGGSYQWQLAVDGSATSNGAIDISGVTGDTSIFTTDDSFVYSGTIYAGARSYADASGSPASLLLIKSTDNGTTWSYVSTIIASNEGGGGLGGQEVGLTLKPDLSILAVIRDNPHTTAWQRISTDLGATWGSLTEVTNTIGIIGRPRIYSDLELKGASEWWKSPVRLMVGFVFTAPPSSQGRQNALWISTDGGGTWTRFYVDAAYEDAGYGDIAWSPTQGKYVYLSYTGTLAAADVKEYLITPAGF